ncbi:hypothetical protein [uncultured Brevundimonas sp.]
MIRIDLQSVVVLGASLAASFATALAIRHLDGGEPALAAAAPTREATR